MYCHFWGFHLSLHHKILTSYVSLTPKQQSTVHLKEITSPREVGSPLHFSAAKLSCQLGLTVRVFRHPVCAHAFVWLIFGGSLYYTPQAILSFQGTKPTIESQKVLHPFIGHSWIRYGPSNKITEIYWSDARIWEWFNDVIFAECIPTASWRVIYGNEVRGVFKTFGTFFINWRGCYINARIFDANVKYYSSTKVYCKGVIENLDEMCGWGWV